MLESLQAGWDAFWAVPHIRVYLTLGWLAYLLGLGAYIVLQKREPVATLSWLISLATLPYLGFAIYYFFGPQKITRHRARRRRQRAGLDQVPATSSETEELRALGHASTGLVPATAREVRLLVDGGEKYPALLEDVAAARDHVHLAYYIYNPDRIGTALRDALVERARAGIRVRLLVDAMGAKQASQRFFAPLLDAGGEVAWFHPARPWMLWRRPWVNLRLHRKLVVVDGRVGYVGGINIKMADLRVALAPPNQQVHEQCRDDAGQLVSMLVEQGRLQEARELWDGRTTDEDRIMPSFITVLTRAENMKRARAAIVENPNDSDALVDMGLAVMDGDHWVVDDRQKRAIVLFKKALDVKPDYPRAQQAIVKAYIQLADTYPTENKNVDLELAKLRKLDPKLGAEMDQYRKEFVGGFITTQKP